MPPSEQQTSLNISDLSGSKTGPLGTASQLSIFTLMSRAKYVPPPTSSISKPSPLSPADPLALSANSLLKHLEKGQAGTETSHALGDIFQTLNSLPTIPANQYFTPGSYFKWVFGCDICKQVLKNELVICPASGRTEIGHTGQFCLTTPLLLHIWRNCNM